MNPRPAHALRLAAAFCLAALGTGCPIDDDASLDGPPGSLAQGAYYKVSFGDACGSGSGKMPSFCRSEGLVALDSIFSEDPRVFRIVPAKDAGGDAEDTGLVFFGVAPGKAKARAFGRFSDGSKRSDAVEITVKAATGLKIRQGCDNDSSGTVRGWPGESVQFDVYPMAGAEALLGTLNALLDSVPGLTQRSSPWSIGAVWHVPEGAVQIPLKSRLFAKPVGTLRTWIAAEISEIRIDDVNQPPYAFSQPDSFALYVRMSAGKLRLCKTPPAVLRTLTPQVCAGPQGETQWTRPNTGYVFARALREGRCQLQAGLDGKTWSKTRALDLFFFTQAPAAWDLAGYGNACKTEGATTCDYGLSGLAVCRDGHWALEKSCAPLQTCDFLPDGGKGCLAGEPCAACRGLRAP
jgi:hypothetical protein